MFSNWSSRARSPTPEPAEKRISTPAGQRLSAILENGELPITGKARESVRTRALSPGLDVPRESLEDHDQSNNSSGYSFNVWSETSTAEKIAAKDKLKFTAIRNPRRTWRKWSWKRIAIIVALILLALIAVVVGVVVGTKKKDSNHESSSPPSTPASGGGGSPANTVNTVNTVNTANPTANPTTTASSPTATTPANFPVGSYSMLTFLDTVQTNCTSNPSTWTCYPNTIYNTSPSKALAIFTWTINSPKSNTYTISSSSSSSSAPFSLSFKDIPLELLDKGTDSERYRFQISTTKTVTPSEKLTDDGGDTRCYFNSTTFQAYLYTRMARSYPDTAISSNAGNPYPEWPFAVRVEQAIGGGENVPNCYTLKNGSPQNQITEGLGPQDQGSLCSCLYKNWRTPGGSN